MIRCRSGRFAGACLGMLILALPGYGATPPVSWGNGFSSVEYRPETGIIAVAIAEWPDDARLFLSGLDATPTGARLHAGQGGERPVALVERPEGWYIFLPPAPPRAGVNEVRIAVTAKPGVKIPVVRFATDNRVRLTPQNGRTTGAGEWRWRIKFPHAGAWIALLTHGGDATVSLAVDGTNQPLAAAQSSAFDGMRVPGLVHIPSPGIHEVTLAGVPTATEEMELQLAAIPEAVLRLPGNAAAITGSGLKISADGISLCNWSNPSDYATWTVPVLLPGRYVVVAEFAAEKDSTLTLAPGTGPVALEVRATGNWERRQRYPVGIIDLPGPGLQQLTARATSNQWNPIDLRELTLYPEATAEPAQTGTLTRPSEAVQPEGQNHFTVPVARALPVGEQIRVNPQATSITNWIPTADYVLWRLEGVRPGRYRVKAPVATMGASRLHLSAGAGTMTAVVPHTGSYENFRELELGELDIVRTHDVLLTVFASPTGWSPVNLGDLELERISD